MWLYFLLLLLLFFFFTFKIWFTYLKVILTEIHCLLAHAPNGPSGQGWSRSIQELHQVSQRRGRSLNSWPIFCYFSRNIRRKLDEKWSSWDMDLWLYGMLALQVSTFPTMLAFVCSVLYNTTETLWSHLIFSKGFNLREKFFFFSKYILSYSVRTKKKVFERQREKEIKTEAGREILHPLVLSPNGCSDWGWARVKQEPKCSGHPPCLPRHITTRELSQKWNSWD